MTNNPTEGQKCVNIHDGTDGIFRIFDNEECVFYKDRRGNVRKTPYSSMVWRMIKEPPRAFPKAIILQVAYEADKKLLEVHGNRKKEWLSLTPEERRDWLEESVDFVDYNIDLKYIRRGLFEAILKELEPLWKEV